MGRFLLSALVLGIYVYVLLDIGRTPKEDVRNLPRLLWVLIVLGMGFLGLAAWFVWGRPRAGLPPANGFGGGGGGSRRPEGGPGPKPPAPLAPDDDPEFLKRLDEQAWAAKMERLRQQRKLPPDDANPVQPSDPSSSL